MELKIHDDVLDLLNELNQMGKAVIFGGYLRDMYFGHVPSDVDIATNIPMDVLEKKYAHMEKAKRRVTTSGQDVFSFKMHKTEKIFVELVSTSSSLYEKSHGADYTMNSLLYDGEKVIDLQNGFSDMKNALIKEVDKKVIENDLSARPFLWLKTLRLVSVTGFNLSEDTYEVLNKNKEAVTRINREIMQTEGHKTLNGKNPFKTMLYLSKMGFISSFTLSDKFIEKKYSLQVAQKLCVMAILAGKKATDEFISFYQFNDDLKKKYEKLYNMYFETENVPSRFKNQIITIKKVIENY